MKWTWDPCKDPVIRLSDTDSIARMPSTMLNTLINDIWFLYDAFQPRPKIGTMQLGTNDQRPISMEQTFEIVGSSR